jgi:hypothetical protein
MRPYTMIRLQMWPDLADCKDEGRKTSMASFRRSVQKSRKKAAARRYLKRKNRHLLGREIEVEVLCDETRRYLC